MAKKGEADAENLPLPGAEDLRSSWARPKVMQENQAFSRVQTKKNQPFSLHQGHVHKQQPHTQRAGDFHSGDLGFHSDCSTD